MQQSASVTTRCAVCSRELPHQKVLKAVLKIDPTPDDHYERYDYFGNRTAYLSIHKPHNKLVVTAVSEVETSAPNLPEAAVNISWEAARNVLKSDPSEEIVEASQYILDSPSVIVNKQLLGYVQPSFAAGRPLVEAVNDLMQRIFQEFKYDPEFSTIATPLKGYSSIAAVFVRILRIWPMAACAHWDWQRVTSAAT
ncbi:MAG: transglutaminase N-terminal domain-containing protein [Syntrophotaleaceae bacterium]